MYTIKEIFYSIQGEGMNTGRPAIFIRFSGCNLWDGRESTRMSAKCQICDTGIIGTDGVNGGKYNTAKDILAVLFDLIEQKDTSNKLPMIVFTGGEPTLQVDKQLIHCLKNNSFYLAIETNGTRRIEAGIDWITLSPKSGEFILDECDEIKLLYPYKNTSPEVIRKRVKAHKYFISPLNSLSPGNISSKNLKSAISFVTKNPDWSISVQTHKYIGIA